MTEHEWLVCDDPKPMIDHLVTIAVRPAKLKAWVFACRNAYYPTASIWGHALDIKESICSAAKEWARCTALTDKVSPQKRVDLLRDIIGNPFRVVYRTRSTVCMRCQGTGKMLGAFMGPTCTGCSGLGYIAQWLPWVMSEATDLATAAYDHIQQDGTLDPLRLAILADAMEEAGCQDENILRHLRGWELCSCEYLPAPKPPGGLVGQTVQVCRKCDLGWRPLRGPHVRGCWAIDLFRANK